MNRCAPDMNRRTPVSGARLFGHEQTRSGLRSVRSGLCCPGGDRATGGMSSVGFPPASHRAEPSKLTNRQKPTNKLLLGSPLVPAGPSRSLPCLPILGSQRSLEAKQSRAPREALLLQGALCLWLRRSALRRPERAAQAHTHSGEARSGGRSAPLKLTNIYASVATDKEPACV